MEDLEKIKNWHEITDTAYPNPKEGTLKYISK